MKYNLERFTGNRRVVEIADGATKGATVGVDMGQSPVGHQTSRNRGISSIMLQGL